MFGLDIRIDPQDIQQLQQLHKKIAFSQPPSYKSTFEKENWHKWLVWGSAAPKPTISLRWKQEYRIFASDARPNAYNEMKTDSCYFTSAPVMDENILYSYTDYYSFLSNPYNSGERGCFYAQNTAGETGTMFGMAQALDLGRGAGYQYCPLDAVPLACNDIASFTPHKFLTVFMRFDDRMANSLLGGVFSADPFHLDYSNARENTVFTVKYNLRYNRFVQTSS